VDTKQWAPTLVDVSEPEDKSPKPSDEESAQDPAPTDDPDKKPHGKIKKRSSVGWLRKWLKGE